MFAQIMRYRFFPLLIPCLPHLPCKFNTLQVKTTAEGSKAQVLFNRKTNIREKINNRMINYYFQSWKAGFGWDFLNCLKIQ